MEIYTKDNGNKIKLTDLEHIVIATDLNIKVIGEMTINKVMEYKHGQMEVDTKDIINKGKNTVMEYINGLMVVAIKVSGKIIRSMVKAHIIGMMVENIKDNGKIQQCTDQAYILGKMADPIKVNINLIENTVMEYITGLMGENIKVFGKTESNMVKVGSFKATEQLDKEYGMMAEERNGQIKNQGQEWVAG